MPAPSSVRLPPNPKVEIEFTAGTWTDVTADVYPDVIAPNTRFGRTSQFSPPQVAAFSVALDNISQKYTPQNTSSVYYPNIQRRKRIRYSYNPGSQRFRFVGYIKQWKPTLVDPDGGGAPFYPVMMVTAADRLDHFSRVTMLAPIHQEITQDKPLLWWPLTDAAGSTQALEQSGNSGPGLTVVGSGSALTFGDNGAGFGDGTGIKFASGQYLQTGGLVIGGQPTSRVFTAEVWFNISAAPGSNSTMATLDGDHGAGSGLGPITIGLNTSRNVTVGYELGTITSSTVASLNGWHHLVLIRDSSNNYTLYVDNANVGSAAGVANVGQWYIVTAGQGAQGAASSLYSGNLSELIVYNVALSTGRIASHYQAGLGYFGDTTDQRIARYLGYAGLTSSDWTLDVGQETVNTYPQAGVDVFTACQDMATTEGGGAVFYIDPTGKARFVNRRYRDNRTPKLTLVGAGDVDPSVYEPSLDDDGLVTRVTVNRASESGTQTSQTYDSGASDVFASDVTTYTISDADALALAQYVVNSQTNAALKFPQISIYLDQADHDLYDQVGQLGIGDRIRVSFPPVAYPVSSLDFFIEGFGDQPDPASGKYNFTADLSAADNPAPRAIWDVSTWDGGDVWAL